MVLRLLATQDVLLDAVFDRQQRVLTGEGQDFVHRGQQFFLLLRGEFVGNRLGATMSSIRRRVAGRRRCRLWRLPSAWRRGRWGGWLRRRSLSGAEGCGQ